MTDERTEWIVNSYESYILGTPEGSSLEETSDQLAANLLRAIMSGEVERPDLDIDWAKREVRTAIAPVRTKRRQSIKKDMEYLRDALLNPDEGVYVEPFLDNVYPIGSHDGRDKAFRYWTTEDLNASVIERYRNAAAVAEAAKHYDEEVQEWLRMLSSRNARMINDMFQAVAA